MKLYFEDTIPRGAEYFSTLGEAVAFNWQDVGADDLVNADYLAVRSTTKVDEALLHKASSLRYVATATAGTNHLDTAYLAQHNIKWNSAGGSNAAAVAEYVISALLTAHEQEKLDLSRITVGVVGAGYVGTALAHYLQALNIAYLLCDPPLENTDDPRHFVNMDRILECEVITLHVPFIQDGEFATVNLMSEQRLEALQGHQLLINACRGEVIDEPALIARLHKPNPPSVVLDVYYNEPNISSTLLEKIWLATPHIAGHSVEGKLRGTQLVYEQFCDQMDKFPQLAMEDFLDTPEPVDFTPEDPSVEALSWAELRQLLISIYDIQDDDRFFRQAMAKSNQFAAIRKSYRVRREYAAYTLRLSGMVSNGIIRQLTGLGFTLEML
ncbi:4-phosphoerythronate dehydrogenase [Alteromonas pelagimontana]|uniref:Erythronate-4-phosphate dehydrogenase n=1 Tax=Alteromonas pelagimontana TaxID=1858656 RepID=A0A6M4MGY4_9ALTE|nr:4-phosphoerythronate dehydrogenase [Alteromonas pelagimontana]QJR82227.1 4-phosphoerythronate dehydrogenase [Alteromonas pelagimontana]